MTARIQEAPTEAGPEMDLLIAQRVFGYAWYPVGEFASGVAPDVTEILRSESRFLGVRRADGSESYYDVDPYSIDLTDAMRALDKVGGIIEIKRFRDHDDPTAFVWHVGDTNNGRATRYAPTLPLAICRYLLAISEAA